MKQIVYKNGTYLSSKRDISWTSKVSPSLSFYPKYLKIVYDAAKLAKAGLYDNEQWCYSSFKILEALEACGVNFDIRGTEVFLDLQEPCIFVGNHMSALETMILPGLISPFKEITFVIKESLLHYPVFKHVMRSRNPIAVTRTNPREDFQRVIEGGSQRLAQGISLVIFPQTTRTIEFDPTQFNSIAIKLAKKSNVPIVPFALKTDAWGNGKRLKDFGKINPDLTVYIKFAEPFYISQKDAEENQKIISFISQCLKDWNQS